MKECLSRRGKLLVRDMSPLMHADFSTRNNRYDPDNNPEGYINMGTAETHLINDEVLDLLGAIHSRMKLTAKGIHYDYFHGSEEFRAAIAAYWKKLVYGQDASVQISMDNVVVGAGCSLALEMLATMLGDPGDVFLIPAPFYSGFIDDIHDRAGIQPVGVHCGPQLDRAAFEAAYAQQIQQGKQVKAVLFSSPNNPTGTVYAKEDVAQLIAFCIEKNIDLISDEIYAQTIHDPAAKWISTMSLVPEHYRDRVHMTSSFAKDFALSGFRTGFAISHNADLLRGMQGLAYYSAVSTHTQAVLTELLQAPELPALIAHNRQQLRAAYLLMDQCLGDMGVPTLPAQGGIFIFADFSAYLDKAEFSEEYTLWRRIFGELKVNISPGQLFDAEEPGWFRICYAHSPAVVEEACRRLKTLEKH